MVSAIPATAKLKTAARLAKYGFIMCSWSVCGAAAAMATESIGRSDGEFMLAMGIKACTDALSVAANAMLLHAIASEKRVSSRTLKLVVD